MSNVGIKFTNVSKSYPLASGGHLDVLSNFNIQIEPGTFTAVLGPSGCGKSTLLRLIAGLERPDRGTISTLQNAPGRDSRIGLMLQQYPSLPWLTVRRNVELGLRKKGGTRSKDRVFRILSQVGLGGWEHAYPYELSGGMLQRLALARTLAMDPDLVLLDEPLGALDALTRHRLQALIRDLYEQTQTTYVMVTHDADEATAIADRIIVLGSAGTGIVYDSRFRTDKIEKASLTSLLENLQLRIGAGTWHGYEPLRNIAGPSGARAFEVTLGLSDSERANSLRHGRLDAAFFTLQGLAAVSEQLAPMNPVLSYVFSRPESPEACERIYVRRDAGPKGRWVIPKNGIESHLLRAVAPDAFSGRIEWIESRAACVAAVVNGDADSCIADPNLVRSVAPWYSRIRLRQHLLPKPICDELLTVLIVPQSLVQSRAPLLRTTQQQLSDAAAQMHRRRSNIHYFTCDEIRSHFQPDLSQVIHKWLPGTVEIDSTLFF